MLRGHEVRAYAAGLLVEFLWTHRQHNFKFGGEQRIFYNNFDQPNYPTGFFSFDQTVSSENPYDTVGGTQGNSFANILIGYGDTGGINVQPAVADMSRETAFYAEIAGTSHRS